MEVEIGGREERGVKRVKSWAFEERRRRVRKTSEARREWWVAAESMAEAM